MDVSTTAPAAGAERGALLDARQKSLLAVLCVAAGILALSMRYVPGDVTRIIWGLAVAALFLALTLVARRRQALRHYWELPFAFFVLALFVLLDNTLPHYIAISRLHTPPVSGNPLASTVGGTVAVQLVEVVIAVALVVGLTKASGGSLGGISLRWGTAGRALVIGIAGFVLFYGLFLLRPGGSQFFPMHGALTRQSYLALTPALLAIVVSNGFLEELVFRGLFLRKYNAFFGPFLANVTQAAIFALAHVGVSYTPFALLFIALIVFPLGLLLGYLMRSSDGILASTLFHAGADIPIYLAFLSYIV